MRRKPNYALKSPKSRFLWVLFTVVFGFLFYLIFEPFGIFTEEGFSDAEVIFDLSIGSIIALIVFLITQFAIKEVLNVKSLLWWQFVLWFLGEALIIASAWSLADLIEPSYAQSFLEVFPENFLAFSLVFSIPYFGIVLWRNAKATESTTSTKLVVEKPEAVTITDETGKTKLIIELTYLLYLNSADNYVEIHLWTGNALETRIIRNTLKKLEPVFANTGVIRCHRSYMVNTIKVSKAQKTNSGMILQLQNLNESIPVSKSYSSEVEKSLKR
ncbi:MAG: LytTR family transcriptional regulator DNA-binding domain-containing protein [Flavobacteriales bacterium]|nr:LytTR family transcriptional regulator DNA-binding domain-containing protein [Flavobacteriales bacterium]